MIAIVDYGMGNIASIKNMLKHLSFKDASLTNDPDQIKRADKLILPGVGSFDNGMKSLEDSGLLDVLNHEVLVNKKPILGVCLGMQLLTNGSEEGVLPGLGWIYAQTVKFTFENNDVKVPHMGWNYINVQRQDELLPPEEKQRFYFVHSYYVKCKSDDNVLATCEYEIEFDCAIRRDNIWGMQFHPEKSHKFGMKVFQNFINL